MKRIGSGIAVAGALLLSSIGLAPAQGARARFAITASECQELGSFFLLDPEVVRPFVPERFEIGLVNGFAELAVVTTTCEDLSIGSTTHGPAFFSEVGVYIDDVDSSPGNWHYYGLWNVSTHEHLARSLARLGVRGSLVEDAGYSSVTGVADASVHVPWRSVPYDVNVVAPGPISPFGLRPSVWWYSDGGGGYIRVVYEAEATATPRSGTGLLQTSPGSDLGLMLGSERRHADTVMIADYARLRGIVSRVRL